MWIANEMNFPTLHIILIMFFTSSSKTFPNVCSKFKTYITYGWFVFCILVVELLAKRLLKCEKMFYTEL